jgi:hypothetical protein
MKKFLIITFTVLVILCAALTILFMLCFYGNPISKFLATKAIKAHLSENYSDTDYELGNVQYDFKFGNYFAHVLYPESFDKGFIVTSSPDGKSVTDDYEWRVTERWNTSNRIYDTYNAALGNALSKDFSHYFDILYGSIIYADEMYEDDLIIPEGAFARKELTLDGEYNEETVSAMGAASGIIVICVDAEAVTSEKMAEILLDIKAVLDSNGVGFYYVDAVLGYEEGEDGTQREGRVEVRHFKYADIYPDGLAERVAAANAAAEEYYKEQDKIKLDGE